jgi:transcription initiation factor TFIIIB Brf1 subunit/transcription initiation factor TFIIB
MTHQQCNCCHIEDQHLIHDTHNAAMVCTTCGRVVEAHMFDETPEWYGDSDPNARAVRPGTYDEYLGTSIGTTLDLRTRGKISKRYTTSDPNHLVPGLKEVERLAQLMGMASEHQMCKSAKTFYTDYAVARKALLRTIRETERVCAAACAVYFGCKSHQRLGDRGSRTIKEISGHCNVHIGKCSKMIKSYKELLADKPYFKLLFTTVTPEDLLSRAVGGLTFEDTVSKNRLMKKARVMFEQLHSESLLEGRTPETVCCAIVFTACELLDLKMSKTSVCTACGISNVILNKALHDVANITWN